MKKFIFGFVIVLLCITSGVAQTKRKKTSAGTAMKSGYYFTVNMCRACLYFDWDKDAVRWFRAKGITAVYGKGSENKTSSQPFATVKRFEMSFDSSSDRPSDILMQIDLYVGPFASEQAASSALEKFPSVLDRIMQKRNKMEGSGGGWDIPRNENVSRSSGNNYEYGFFFIKGYRLKP